MRTALFILVLLCVFAAAPSVHAQGFSGGIVPNCGTGPCQACHVVKLADNVLRFGIYAATVVATLMLVYAGILYVTSSANPANIEKAHGIFWNVIIGFVIVLIAWILVSTLLRVFMGQGRALPWDQLTCNIAPQTTTAGPNIEPIPGYHCIAQDSAGCTDWERDLDTLGASCLQFSEDGTTCLGYDQAPPPGAVCLGYDPDNRCVEWREPGSPGSASDILDQAQAVSQLRDAGVCVVSSIDQGNCYGRGVQETCPQVSPVSSGGATGCTSLSGIRQDTVSSIIATQNACGCTVTITGGNEPGHQTHQYGYNVDIAQTSALTSYLRANVLVPQNQIGYVPGYGYQYKDSSGNCWLVEGNHYHFSQSCRSQ